MERQKRNTARRSGGNRAQAPIAGRSAVLHVCDEELQAANLLGTSSGAKSSLVWKYAQIWTLMEEGSWRVFGDDRQNFMK